MFLYAFVLNLYINVYAERQGPGVERLRAGIEDYEDGRYEEAIFNLEMAKIQISENDKDSLWKVYFHLGLSYYLTGDNDEAKKEFSKSQEIIKNKTPDPDIQSPKIVELFNEVLKLKIPEEFAIEQIFKEEKEGFPDKIERLFREIEERDGKSMVDIPVVSIFLSDDHLPFKVSYLYRDKETIIAITEGGIDTDIPQTIQDQVRAVIESRAIDGKSGFYEGMVLGIHSDVLSHGHRHFIESFRNLFIHLTELVKTDMLEEKKGLPQIKTPFFAQKAILKGDMIKFVKAIIEENKAVKVKRTR